MIKKIGKFVSDAAVEQNKRVLKNHSLSEKHAIASGVVPNYVTRKNKKRQKVFLNKETTNDTIMILNNHNNNNHGLNVEYMFEESHFNEQTYMDYDNYTQLPLYYEIKFCILLFFCGFSINQ